jgi:peptide/nickel transport system permease protein
VLIVLASLIGPLFSPWGATDMSLTAIDSPPSMSHWFGTDLLGRDILTRVMVGGRESLTIVVLCIAIGGAVGTALGLIAGYRGGWIDAVIARLIDAMSAFPSILIALALAVTVGSGLWVVVGVISLVLWSGYARLVRAEALSWKEREFVLAAVVTGCRPARIVSRHVLPNLVSTVIVYSTLQVGFIILSEAALSFLGAGIPPPTPTWGGMISDGQAYISSYWWMAVFPGIAMTAVIVSANRVGDWLRDEFDPRLRQL